MIIAEAKFIVNISRERIWQLLLKAMMNCVSFERMQLIDERNFHGQLPMKMGFIPLRMDVKLQLSDVSPLELLVTLLKAKSMLGIIWLNQRVTFTLRAVDKDKTEISCQVVEEGMATLLRVFFLWKVKSFASLVLKGVEDNLRQWA